MGDDPDDLARRSPLALVYYYLIALGGTVANVIQVASTGDLTREGLTILAVLVAASVLPAAYQVGRKHERAAAEPAAVVERPPVAELVDTNTALETTLAGYRPYWDDLTIVFDLGERPGDDRVEEFHAVTPVLGPNVYWGHFEAASRGPTHDLDWDSVGLRVERTPKHRSEPEQAGFIRLRSRLPRALVLFAPPSDRVEWSARYVSRGYWDPLRRDRHQKFSWIPPAVGLDEESGRRSPVRSVTFVFGVPPQLGTLADPGFVPPGVTFSKDRSGRHRYTVTAVGELPGAGPAADPISWYLELVRPGGAS
ncbi:MULTISPECIES: hypothetical protein [Actinoplanes]|uniref:hypothetical protein n=1 Tax=Actinoplanes TaxID=1865 RepID=UPI0005F2CAF3|nr:MULTISPECIES: hypothetical protein [Actinoplanes]GLY02908.1 hypothetical protein Acsp01_32870 [Actinoplanes sp. NBRC 101535]